MTDADGAAAGCFAQSGRVVIVGASLAGLYAAEALRKEGFAGQLTLIGDEPYDRPPCRNRSLPGGCRWSTRPCSARGISIRKGCSACLRLG